MSKKTVYIALLASLGTILFTLESMIPMPVPWLRIGLANIVTLTALLWWGIPEAFLIVLLRVFLGSLLTGKLFSPSFIVSLTGSLSSALVMGSLLSLRQKIFSIVGISVWGAFIKNCVQLILVYLLFVRQEMIFHLLPIFLIFTLLSGIPIGLLVYYIDEKLSPLIQKMTI